MDLLKELLLAKNTPRPLKSAYLLKSQSYLEISVLKTRLLLELKLVNETKIFQIQAKFDEIGRMLGGWYKSLNT